MLDQRSWDTVLNGTPALGPNPPTRAFLKDGMSPFPQQYLAPLVGRAVVTPFTKSLSKPIPPEHCFKGIKLGDPPPPPVKEGPPITDPARRIGFNSYSAGSSVNHLHFRPRIRGAIFIGAWKRVDKKIMVFALHWIVVVTSLSKNMTSDF